MVYLNYCEDKWIESVRGGGPITTQDYPRFRYISASFSDRVGTAIPDLGLLAAWSILFFVVGYVTFLKYDVR